MVHKSEDIRFLQFITLKTNKSVWMMFVKYLVLKTSLKRWMIIMKKNNNLQKK